MIKKLFRSVFRGGKSGTVTINGVDYVGNDIRIVVDGVDHIVHALPGQLLVKVQGDADLVETSQGDVEVSGNATEVRTSQGDVIVNGDVLGNATTSQGDISALLIHGHATTNLGDIYGANT